MARGSRAALGRLLGIVRSAVGALALALAVATKQQDEVVRALR